MVEEVPIKSLCIAMEVPQKIPISTFSVQHAFNGLPLYYFILFSTCIFKHTWSRNIFIYTSSTFYEQTGDTKLIFTFSYLQIFASLAGKLSNC